MRFTLDVVPADSGWDVRALTSQETATEAEISPTRRLGSTVIAGKAYPLPPAAEGVDLPPALDSGKLASVVTNVLNGSGSADIPALGKYLFDVLVGPVTWAAVESTAGAETIEIAIRSDPSEATFHGLPWELMSSGDGPSNGFLAARRGVSIIRQVADTNDQVHQLRAIGSPPKVLFVVGSALNDPSIRPGAEYLGLLRHLRAADRQLNSRIVREATVDDLVASLKSFQPEVVHFICHGEQRETGPSLLFRPQQGSQDANDYVNAARLLRILNEADAPPSIAVMNACATAAADQVDVGRPLAADLVKGGVPIVIGMSGTVADQACRLFTREFYSELLTGGNVAVAAARGRRAAITFGSYDPTRQIDWALPAMYVADAAADAVVKVYDATDDRIRLDSAALFTIKDWYPPFCGRWDVFDQYRRLMSSGGPQFLVVSSPSIDPAINKPLKYGSTRLLCELAAEAFRDGHIPILMTKTWLDTKLWPGKLDEFMELLRESVGKTVGELTGLSAHRSLDVDWGWTELDLVQAVVEGKTDAELPDGYRLISSDAGKQAKAFGRDLLRLHGLVCAQRGVANPQDVKLLLLIEDFHQLVFEAAFFEMLGRDGLNHPDLTPIARGVIAYHERGTNSQETTVERIKQFEGQRNAQSLLLGPLHPPVPLQEPRNPPEPYEEAALVYRNFLLGWKEGHQVTPLVPTEGDDAAATQNMIVMLGLMTGGIPGMFVDERATLLIKGMSSVRPSALRPADDEAALLAAVGDNLGAGRPQR